jgi:hypothetical protein
MGLRGWEGINDAWWTELSGVCSKIIDQDAIFKGEGK